MSELDEIFADINKDGDTDPFKDIKEDETPSESQPETKEKDVEPVSGDTPKDEPESTEKTKPSEDEDTPFHKRWEKREEKLNAEWQEKFDSFKQGIEKTVDEKKQDGNIPDWFSELYGDNQVAWQKYSEHDNARTEEIEKRIIERQEQAKKKETDESTKWERWVDDEVDKLKSEGLTFDKNELIKTVIDWRPTDEKGNYDLRKAYDILEMQKAKDNVVDKVKSDARKVIADTTTKTTKGEAPKKDYLTSHDLRGKTWNQL